LFRAGIILLLKEFEGEKYVYIFMYTCVFFMCCSPR